MNPILLVLRGAKHIPEGHKPRKLGTVCLSLLLMATSAWARPPAPAAFPGNGFVRGVVYSSWDGSYPHQAAWAAHLKHFKAQGVTDIEVMTFAHQPDVNRPTIVPSSAKKWPRAFISAARKQGFRILLKPHVWSRQFYDGSKRWRGSIAMPDDATWAQWFAQYEAFILREAKLAEIEGVERFSIGLEYVEATKGHGKRWRALIAKVRKMYSGQLTYAADGNHELGHVDFWDALDFIGVDAYFKLSEKDRPSKAEIAAAWPPVAKRLAALSARYQRPIVFTEAGYPSIVGAARTPWRWPDRTDTPDLALQADLFEAMLATCTTSSWCAGLYWWKYYEQPERTPHAVDYSPRGKPAEAVLKGYFRGLRE